MTITKGKLEKDRLNLNLVLIYLNGWEEDSRRIFGGKVIRAWKAYPFDILNELDHQGLIRQFDKSLIITNLGISRAEGLMQEYFDPQKRV